MVVRLQPIFLSALLQWRRNLNFRGDDMSVRLQPNFLCSISGETQPEFRGDEMVVKLQPIFLSVLFQGTRNLNFRGDELVARL